MKTLVLAVGPVLARCLEYEISMAELATITAKAAEASLKAIKLMHATDIRFFTLIELIPSDRALISDEFVYEP